MVERLRKDHGVKVRTRGGGGDGGLGLLGAAPACARVAIGGQGQGRGRGRAASGRRLGWRLRLWRRLEEAARATWAWGGSRASRRARRRADGARRWVEATEAACQPGQQAHFEWRGPAGVNPGCVWPGAGPVRAGTRPRGQRGRKGALTVIYGFCTFYTLLKQGLYTLHTGSTAWCAWGWRGLLCCACLSLAARAECLRPTGRVSPAPVGGRRTRRRMRVSAAWSRASGLRRGCVRGWQAVHLSPQQLI